MKFVNSIGEFGDLHSHFARMLRLDQSLGLQIDAFGTLLKNLDRIRDGHEAASMLPDAHVSSDS